MSQSVVSGGAIEESSQDVLTGLGNRRSYFQVLDARVETGDRPAILYIDIDKFKEVNDRLGRLAGDSALRVISRRLSSVVRPTDELARIGGDEFAILCASDVTETQVIGIAARVIEQLAEPISIGDAPALKIGASIGIVLGFPQSTTSDTLLASADAALCEAKASGRSCWRVAPVPERQRV
jgi:diguanylate cyclase (GGDEF)-like protein